MPRKIFFAFVSFIPALPAALVFGMQSANPDYVKSESTGREKTPVKGEVKAVESEREVMSMQVHDHQIDIEQLNSFLQEEKAAVETYQKYISSVEAAVISSGLGHLQQSHQKRVMLLAEKVRELGGTPDIHSGTWGGFAKMFENGAKLFGKRFALYALEEGEDRGMHNYERKAGKLSPESQLFINSMILPEQKRSHDELNRIREMVH